MARNTSLSSRLLTAYTFFGLIPLDASWLRTVCALAACSIFLLWCSREDAPDERDREAWQWNQAASRSLLSMLILSASAVVPFGLRWFIQPPTGTQAVQDAGALVAYLIFSFSISMVVYLMRLLAPAPAPADAALDLESLRLEHQACISIFQTAATCMVVFFLGAVLSPTLGARTISGGGGVTITMLAWGFYWFAGFIIWFLRPCLDRAKAIRRQLEHRRETAGRVTPV